MPAPLFNRSFYLFRINVRFFVANCIFLCYNHFRTNVLICPVLFMITEENSSTQLLLGIFIKLTMEDGWLEACLVFFLWKSGTVHRRTDA